MASFDLIISYNQIAVFNSDLENPFNDWSDAQVDQGFSWRSESVSFKTLLDGVVAHVEFLVCKEFSAFPTSIRAISVPFSCNSYGEIEVATITGAQHIFLDPGQYQLVFEAGLTGSESWYRISVIPNGLQKPQILVADSELAPSYPLIMGPQSA